MSCIVLSDRIWPNLIVGTICTLGRIEKLVKFIGEEIWRRETAWNTPMLMDTKIKMDLKGIAVYGLGSSDLKLRP